MVKQQVKLRKVYWFFRFRKRRYFRERTKAHRQDFEISYFDDEQGKMGWNVSQANGGVLLVSQFTLMAQTQKGLRLTLVRLCRLATQKHYMNS